MLTLTDIFAGAGGSSTGVSHIPGVEVVHAANHWPLAVEVHNQNHPDADHSCVDLHVEDPRHFPRTDILWASPECTKWSQASGGKYASVSAEGDLLGLLDPDLVDEDAETAVVNRSRLLMFDVLRFAEHHQYRAMVIENVVDIATNARFREAWSLWRKMLGDLGYAYRVVSLNSMHAQAYGDPAPQSRDRLYVVCWRKGDRVPDIDAVMRPQAWCPECREVVESQQAFKNGRTVGKYRAQYVYVHGACGTTVEPGYLPAAAAIDWSKRGKRIGDRDKPLAEKTRKRIAAGIARYWRPMVVQMEGRADALVTQPPFITELRGGGSDARPVAHPLSTVTASGNHHGLVVPWSRWPLPGWSSCGAGHWSVARRHSMCHHTLTTVDRYALIQRHNSSKGDGAEMLTPASEYLRTLTTSGHQSVITPGDVKAAEAQVDDCYFRMLEPDEVARGMAFPADYIWGGTRQERVKLAGNAVTPPAARDLMATVVAALN